LGKSFTPLIQFIAGVNLSQLRKEEEGGGDLGGKMGGSDNETFRRILGRSKER